MTSITLINVDSFTSYLKPFTMDICVAALIGLSYFIYRTFYKSQNELYQMNEKLSKISKINNKWDYANSIQKFHYLINSNEEKKTDAFFILEKMHKNGVAPDIVTYNCLLDMSFRLRQIIQSNKLYEEINDFTSPVQPEIITFNILLKSCVREIKENYDNCDFVDKIFIKISNLLVDIKSKNLKFNDITYNTLIDAYAEGGRMDKSWEFYNEMILNNFKPDLYTYATLIKGLKSTSYSDVNFEKAFDIFNLIKSGQCEGLKIDEFIYNTVLDTCLRYNKIKLMEELFQEMKNDNLMPTIVTYSIMIKAYGNAYELDKALDLFNELRKNGIRPNDIVYGCLMNCCVKCSKQDLMTEIFEDMKNEGIIPNLFIYATLIKGYNKMKQYQLAFDAFEKMKNDNFVQPNIVIYNSIIDNCVESKNYEKMFEIYTFLKNSEGSVQPNIITYSTLIKGFCKSGNMTKANEIYRFLIENNLKLDDVVFNTLCDGYAKQKDIESALNVLKEMKQANIRRTVVIYTVLIRMYSSLGDEKNVYEMVSEMKKEGINPSIVVYTSIVQVLNRLKKTEEVLKIYQEVKNNSNLKIDHLLYSFIINGCVFNKRLEKAIEILLESVDDGIKLNEETYNNVLEYLLANKFMKTSERISSCSVICKALKEKSYQINIDLYNRLMKIMYKPTENVVRKDENQKRKYIKK